MYGIQLTLQLQLGFWTLEAKYLANPSVLEPALQVMPVSAVSDLAVSQLTGVIIILAFDGLVWYNIGRLVSRHI